MGENSDNPWALLFMEDYEEQKTAHKGAKALTARQGSAIHNAQKHKSTKQPFMNRIRPTCKATNYQMPFK